MRMRIRIEK
uniref:Uncharacterized protein n=1 Tax=Rhizophora mucronata TaxID=61149 RepID=A0A2P2IV99_RHIMU